MIGSYAIGQLYIGQSYPPLTESTFFVGHYRGTPGGGVGTGSPSGGVGDGTPNETGRYAPPTPEQT